MKKRVLSILLCLCLVCSLLPSMALAADIEVTIEIGTNGVPTATSGTGWSYISGENTLTLNRGYAFTLTGGAFTGTVNNYGTITDGVFNGTVNNTSDTQNAKTAGGTINGGTFNGEVNNYHGWGNCTINGGTFNGDVLNGNHGYIYGGTFNGMVDYLIGGKNGILGGNHAIVFDLGEGNWATDYTAPTSYPFSSTKVFTLPTAENIVAPEGYKFDGWYTVDEYGGRSGIITSIPAKSYGAVKYYASYIEGNSYSTWRDLGMTAAENTDYTVDASGNYTVKTPAGLAYIANIVNSVDNLYGKTVLLENDIDLYDGGVAGYKSGGTITEDNSWIPIDGFAGTFDGCDNAIRNLYVITTSKDAGLFGSNGGAIMNLELASGRITINLPDFNDLSEYHAGGIAATSSGLIENCINRVSVQVNTDGMEQIYAGGIAGLVISTGATDVAAVRGCSNFGTISSRGEAAGNNIYGGGIVGGLTSGGTITVEGKTSLIDHCYNAGSVNLLEGYASYAGGIAGKVSTAGNTTLVVELRNSENHGTVYGTQAGGIAGFCDKNVKIANNFNWGAVTGGTNAGGIVGLHNGSSAIVENCYSNGQVTGAANANIGGIVGNNNGGSVANGYYLDTTASGVTGANSGTITDSYAFATNGTDHTYTDGEGTNRVLLESLNAWVQTQRNPDYLRWIKDRTNHDLPIFGDPLYDCYVDYDSMGGTPVERQYYMFDELIVAPDPAPTREGYTFVGWFGSTGDGGNNLEADPFDFGNKKADGFFTLYAKWEPVDTPDEPQDAVKEIMIKIRGIDDPVKEVKEGNAEKYQYLPSDYIYLGMYENTPIKWRVLDKDQTNSGVPGMFLLSELLYGDTADDDKGKILFADSYERRMETVNGKQTKVYYKDDTYLSYLNDYQGSLAQKWCTDFASTNYFDAKELGALLKVSKGTGVGCLNNEVIFCLSEEELTGYLANYQKATELIVKSFYGNNGAWWLRTPSPSGTQAVYLVTKDGLYAPQDVVKIDELNGTIYETIYEDQKMRPATNLDLDAILFTSAAIDGKLDAVDSVLKLIPDYTGNEWKATIYDASRSAFDAEFVSANGAEWTISYSNAVTGIDEYISALVTDEKGDAVYYGVLALVDDTTKANGTVVVTLPNDFDWNKNTLYIFNEQRNDNKQTDYSGDLIPIEYKEAAKYTVSYDLNGGTGADGVNYDPATVAAGTEDTVKAAPTRDGHTFTGWSDGTTTYQPGDKIIVNGDIMLTAQWSANSAPGGDIVITTGSVHLTKVDAEDNGKTLSDVVFELYRANGVKQGTYTTNASGVISVYALMPGSYYFVETRPAEGYLLDSTKHEFTVFVGNTTRLTVENRRSNVPEAFTLDHYAYVVGYNDGMVHPEANITRAEVATIFFRLLAEEVRQQYMTRQNNFPDVNVGDWYNTAVSTMAAMGIVSGYPDGNYYPDAYITRAEFAAIAARFDDKGNTTGVSFSDIYGHWAEDEICIAANNGWILGYDGRFRPDDDITRAEAMSMINRVLQRIPDSVDDLLPGMVIWPDNMDARAWYYLAVQEATNSHDYGRYADGSEYWIRLRAIPNWAELER